MEQNGKSVIEVKLKDDVYYVDIARECLVLKEDPDHHIPYEHMYFRNGRYEFTYDPAEKYVHIPFDNAEGVVMVNLPLLIETDMEMMLQKYHLEERDLTIGTLKTLKDQEAALLYRLKGNLPMIDIASSAFSLDVGTASLNTLYGLHRINIPLIHYADISGNGGYTFLYHQASDRVYSTADNNFRSGSGLLEVQLPSLEHMDPIGMAIKHGNHPLDLIWTHPQQQWTKAQTISMKERMKEILERQGYPDYQKGFLNPGHKRKSKIKR